MRERKPIAFSTLALAAIPLISLGALAVNRHATPANAAKTSPLRVLIVGGGPTPDYNQHSIETNVRYVSKLTPNVARKTILFADGSKTRAHVNYLATAATSDENATLLSWIFDEDPPDDELLFRRSQLPVINGANTKTSIARALKALQSQPKAASHALLFFTGHGGQGRTKNGLGAWMNRPDWNNNYYAGWNDSDFSVRDFAAQLKAFSPKRPLVLVMVQCYSGAFANLLFQNGDPEMPVVNRDFCGFFASIKERPAAGCTPEVNEANYQDFTSYFFAALSGRNRSGARVTGADYDGNKMVSMSEAFAYTNIHDASIDVPVSTSDVFLRSLASSDETWWQTPYSQVLADGTQWQKAILQQLSQRLKLVGENRLSSARQQLDTFGASADEEAPVSEDETEEESEYPWSSAALQQRETWRRQLLKRFPALKSPGGSVASRRAHQNAVAYLKARPIQTRLMRQEIQKYWESWQESGEDEATREARLLRFVRAARSVVLERELINRKDIKNLAILKRFRVYESRNPLL